MVKNEKPQAELNGHSHAYHEAKSVEELTQRNVETILRLEAAADENRTASDWIASVISNFCGSMTFVWAHVIYFGSWIILNTVPGIKHFDPLPFSFLTLAVSLEAIFLSMFILISQNRQTRLSERRNHLDLQINLLTEQENTKMLQMLQHIARKLDADMDEDPDVKVLEQATRPERLLQQIEQAIEKDIEQEAEV